MTATPLLSLVSDDALPGYLKAAHLRPTFSLVLTLQALRRSPGRWTDVETLHREVMVLGMGSSKGTLYRVLNQLTQGKLVQRRLDTQGKQLFRLRPDEQTLHRIVCDETGELLALTEDISPEHVSRLLDTQGLALTDACITVRVKARPL